MNVREGNFALAGAACKAVLESMIEFGYIPACHLDQAKRVVAEHNDAQKAWEDSLEIAA